MSAPQQRYGAANAYRATYTEYAPDPALPVHSLMSSIARRLLPTRTPSRSSVYGPGPGTPEVSFTGYSPPAPQSMPRATISGVGGGRPIPDAALNTMASGLSDSQHNDVVNAIFADRLRRRGVAL
jgi:hypothetical protein